MATGEHAGGPGPPGPDAPDPVIQKLEQYRRWLAAISLWPRLVAAAAVAVIIVAVVFAFAPEFPQLATLDQGPPAHLRFTAGWRYVFIGVALCVAFLLAMYLAESSRARLLAEKLKSAASAGRLQTAASDAFTIHSPAGFVEDLDKFLEYGHAGWGQRGLYVGLDGARSWIHVSQHPDYEIAENKLRPKLQEVMAGVDGLGSVISLGPGDGRVDDMLMSGLWATQGHGTSYVPIDISEGLLLATMKRFRKQHRDVRMPFGILGDFEYGWDHLRYLLASQQHPRLYSVLGNTVSNIDVGLERFFPDFWAGILPGDYVLFDVLLGDFDEVLGSGASGPFDPNLLFPQDQEVMRRYKKFIGYGARRVASDHGVFDEETGELTKRLTVHRRKDAAGGYDQLHLEYKPDAASARTIFKWRRYGPNTTSLEKLLRDLRGCRVINEVDVTDDGKTTRLILLRRDGLST